MDRRALPLLAALLPALTGCLPERIKDSGQCTDPEICNGEDDDCDGEVDEEATDASVWYPDGDGDGYGVEDPSTEACEAPSGYVAEEYATGGASDCDDSDEDINPGADETWYDGVDQNCDEWSDYDQDGDGYDAEGITDGDDCDDTDAEVNPGAAEIWYDGLDQDCDGASDYDQDTDGFDHDEHGGPECYDPDAQANPEAEEIWYDGVDQDCDGSSDYDADGDGYDSSDHEGEDCDDSDELINPDAAEIWYDGRDGNCDGASDYDADGDGFDHEDYDGEDCDDDDASIHPGAFEWIDGDDNDCDGVVDQRSLGDADAILLGEAGGDEAGYCVAAAGDVNNDGTPDILVGAYGNDRAATGAGAAYLLYGPITSSTLAAADATMLGIETDGAAGLSVAGAGDVNNDSYDDMLIGAPWEGAWDKSESYTGKAYLVLGPASGSMQLDLADGSYQAWGYGDAAGWAVAGGGDLDADGNDDLVIGAPDASTVGLDAGAAYVVYGPGTGSSSLGEARGAIHGDSASQFTGCSVAMIPDTDGDGFDDLLIGAAGSGISGVAVAGGAYLFNGPVTGTLSISDADASLQADSSSDQAGASVAAAGDVNGDGSGDLLVGAPYADAGDYTKAGKSYLIQTPVRGSAYLWSASTARIDGTEDYCYAATPAAAGDVNGDGTADILVGALGHDGFGENSGAAYLFLGTIGGSNTLADADAVLHGEDDEDGAGISLTGVGDSDLDGYDDLLIGANFSDDGGSQAGAAYLVLGGP